jgi:uncharacterized protein
LILQRSLFTKKGLTVPTSRFTRVAWLVVGLCLVPLVYAVVMTVRLEVAGVHPARKIVSPAPAWLVAAHVQNITLQTRDGLRLNAWLTPTQNGAAVALVHGYGGSRADMLDEAQLLQTHGYGVLMLDSRCHGESEGTVYTHGDRERADISAVVDYLSTMPGVLPGRIALLGFSTGTAQVALEGTRDARVAALILEAPVSSILKFTDDEYGRWRFVSTPVAQFVMRRYGIDVDAVSPVRVIAALAPRPLLIVHGDRDPIIPLARAREVYRAAREPKELLIIHGAGHGGYMATEQAEYSRALIGFLDSHLLPSTTPEGAAADDQSQAVVGAADH